MQISVDLSLSPLQDGFEAPKNSLKMLRNSGFFGKGKSGEPQIYNALMRFLSEEIKQGFNILEDVVPTMKLVKSNRSDYAVDF